MAELTGGGALKKEQEDAVVEMDSEEEEAERVVKRRRRRRRKKKACDPQQKRACVDCTKRCARIHGRAASPSSSKARPIPAVPSFFKVMMGYFSDDVDIPPPFARTILDLAGSNIYLEDAFGLRWRVRLCLSDGVLSFGHGWKNFVLDHAVSCGEFLVFRQIARSVFTVQMFAPSAVERLFLCEKNKRQSRKRKPKQKTSSPSIQTVKTSNNNVESRKKKQRTDHHNDLGPKDSQMPDHVCLDDSDVPISASELKCSETPGGVPEVGVAEPQGDSEAPTRHECEDQEALDGDEKLADDCTISEEQRGQCNARVTEHSGSDATEMEHDEDFNLPTNDDASGSLSLMDLNEGSIDDIFLSADMYEFEADMCNPEAFAADLNMEGPIATAQTSGFSCLEVASQNHHSSMGVDQSFVMPAETLSCGENKEMTDALETVSGYVCAAVHGIDINAFPANESSPFAENSSPPADAEVQASEFALSSCTKDKDSDSLACKDSQGEQKEGLLRAKTSVTHDKQQDGQGDKQVSTDDKYQGLQSGIFESDGVLALAAACSKFCIVVPAPGQTWLELPGRLPVIPRTKKQGRKVVILRDPCMRLWPVLYQCTPRFSGFITGWVDICRENNLQEGDTCEFELSSNSELSFQVIVPTLQ